MTIKFIDNLTESALTQPGLYNWRKTYSPVSVCLLPKPGVQNFLQA
jgi:hypothetical protein